MYNNGKQGEDVTVLAIDSILKYDIFVFLRRKNNTFSDALRLKFGSVYLVFNK